MAKETLKEAAIGFLTRVVAGDVRGAYEQYVGDAFRHHNPFFPADALSLRKGMEEDEARHPGKKLEVVQALEDGDRVAVHSRLRGANDEFEMAVVHLFRFEHGRIAELWDVGQAVPKEVVNRNGMF